MNEAFSKLHADDSGNSFQLNSELFYNGIKLSFDSFSESEVHNALFSIKSNAVGYDGIHIKLIKLILHFILPIMTHIFNLIITTSTYPSNWKIGHIIPVAKKNSPTDPDDFRPISILSCLSKVFEKLISIQICKHLNDNKLLSRYQSGFQAGKSCNTAVLKIFEDIRPSYDRGDLTILVLIDFSKAFDCVNYKILLKKLYNYFGFSCQACALLESYLTGRSQFVHLSDSTSNIKNTNSGVPQGSILGPILFSIFINDIVSCCESSSIHLYADDAQIYLSRPPGLIEDLIFRLNEDLANILNWSEANNLSINILKTQAICLHNKSVLVRPQQLKMINTDITFSDEVKNLGFIINSKLNCKSHITSTIQKIYIVLRKLWCIASFLHTEVKLKLVKIFIIPLIIYGANVYGNLDSASLNKLQLTVNNCARFVYNKRKYDHISTYSKNILGSNLKAFLDTRNLLFIHKLIFNKTPDYLFECLIFSNSKRTNNLAVPVHRHLTTSRMFFINAVNLWNQLPHHIKNIANLKIFKSALYKINNSILE